MENNIQNWLNMINDQEGSEYTLYDCNPVLIERYKNFCTKELEALILGFRQKVNDINSNIEYEMFCEDFINNYDKYFNIKTNRL